MKYSMQIIHILQEYLEPYNCVQTNDDHQIEIDLVWFGLMAYQLL